MLRLGVYDLEGNHVEYDGGSYAFDFDSAEMIPVDYLKVRGTFIETFEEMYERMDEYNLRLKE